MLSDMSQHKSLSASTTASLRPDQRRVIVIRPDTVLAFLPHLDRLNGHIPGSGLGGPSHRWKHSVRSPGRRRLQITIDEDRHTLSNGMFTDSFFGQ